MIIDLNLEERSWVAICLEEKITSAEKNFEATKDCYWSDQVETLTKITKKL
jgi:hypothetical protein